MLKTIYICISVAMFGLVLVVLSMVSITDPVSDDGECTWGEKEPGACAESWIEWPAMVSACVHAGVFVCISLGHMYMYMYIYLVSKGCYVQSSFEQNTLFFFLPSFLPSLIPYSPSPILL
jgi:hypothetical protein